jgi:DNA-binding FadR family transcriptional regulator
MQIELSDTEIERIADRLAEKILHQVSTAPRLNGSKLTYSEREAAELIGVSRYTLKRWRELGHIAAHHARRPILYTHQDIEQIHEWMRSRHP